MTHQPFFSAFQTTLLLAMSLLLTSTTASAGEISLFEGSAFGGQQVSLRNAVPSIGNVGFNDRASSIVVRSGRWEVCSDDGFRGQCAIFEPGQYASLDARFNKQVSSVREIAVVNANAVSVPVQSTNAMQLYDQPNFRGGSIVLNNISDDLKRLGFNDRASSLIVQSGTWELCSNPNFGGTCRSYGPGRYSALGSGMTRTASSARPIVEQAAAVHAEAWSDQRRNETVEHSPLILFSREGMNGRSLAIVGNVADMKPAKFDNVAQSVLIESGYWEFCSDRFYRGTCRVFGPGQLSRLEPALQRSISSVRMVAGNTQANVRPNRNGAEIDLFTAPSFIGNRFPVRQNLADFRSAGYNDMIGSVIVHSGQWELCVDANYGGGCTVFGPGRYSNLGGLTNQLSSVRRID